MNIDERQMIERAHDAWQRYVMRLREEDRENLSLTFQRLSLFAYENKARFAVFVVGSSVLKSEYSDIDLLVCPIGLADAEGFGNLFADFVKSVPEIVNHVGAKYSLDKQGKTFDNLVWSWAFSPTSEIQFFMKQGSFIAPFEQVMRSEFHNDYAHPHLLFLPC